MSLTIALVDDHILVRTALSDMLIKNGYKIVCHVGNGLEILEFLEGNPMPDIILLDLNMPVMDGYATMEEIAKKYNTHNVIALSMYDNEQSVVRIIKAGAKGYLLKESQPKDLLNAIHTVYEKGFYYSDLVNKRLVKLLQTDVKNDTRRNNLIEFTSKEIEILQFFCTEMSYKEIGARMNLSPRTIESYRDNLFEKTCINSRIGLMLYAIKNGVVRI